MATNTWTGSGGTAGKPKSGDWNTAANWSTGHVPADGDAVVLGGGPNSADYTVTLNTGSANLDSVVFGSSGGVVTLDIETPGVLNITNTLTVGALGKIELSGGQISANSIDLTHLTSMLSGFGLLNLNENATGSGIIDAQGGTLEVSGTVAGSIQLQIATGSDLKLDNAAGTVATPGTVTFAAGTNETLDLTGEGRGSGGEVSQFKETVVGFASGDKIELKGAAGDTLSFSNDVLTVKDGTSVEATITLAGNYTASEFQFSAGNTDIITICFMAGTMIATPEDGVAVENLRRGDMVLTADGRKMPVCWLGRQTVSTVFGDPLRVLPIRIKAGALGDNVPCRDLLVSPDHALLIDGALIQAGALVNDRSIIREKGVPQTFTYYHVELDDHSLILAENTPAETFVDNIERLAFDNWAEHQALYPHGKAISELSYPRAKAHRQVPVNVRVKLAERAQLIAASSPHAAVA